MGTQLDIFAGKSQEDNYTAESYTGIYGMHKYWSKKPYNIMRSFIQKYSEPGAIVLDPFCGSGISIIEGVITNRKSVGFDINPSAIFITKQVLARVSVIRLYESFRHIESRVKEKINSFYQVKRNGNSYQGTHFLWENNLLTEVWYQNGTRKKIIDKANEDDLLLSNSFSYENIEHYYPTEKFYHNTRINAYGNQRISDLFTPRNLKALALLMNEIEKVKDEAIRNVLKFCFTSAVGQASKMVFVVKNRGKMNGGVESEKKEVGSWVIGYWTPNENFEINVWNCFENKFNKILKAKKTQENSPYSIKETENFTELSSSDYNLMILNQPAQIGLKNLPDNSIDYVITDPPHGNRIPYLELSMMWNSWLRKTVDYENEIIVSEARERKKEILRELAQTANINVENVQGRHLFEHLFCQNIPQATIDAFIRHVYQQERIERIGNEENLYTQLYRLQVFDWGGFYQNAVEQTIVNNYIKKIRDYNQLLHSIENDLTPRLRGYILCSWYNHWTSILIEDMFKDHPDVLPAVGLVKKVDFFWHDFPFDLKVTYFPDGFMKEKRRQRGLRPELTELKAFARQNNINFDRNATDDEIFKELLARITESPSEAARSFIQAFHQIRRDIIDEAVENPNELIVWFYENQGTRRFDAANRCFLVLIDRNNLEESWKLKRNREILNTRINNYLSENRDVDFSRFRINFSWEGTNYQSYATCLFLIRE